MGKNKKQKQIVIRILAKIAKSFLAILLILALYLITAFVLSRIPVGPEAQSSQDVEIYILTNGVHTDLVLPTVNEYYNWSELVSHLDTNLIQSEYNYLAFGWGDKGFYLNTPTWAELKASTALKAMIGISGTAMHTTYYKRMKVSDDCRKLVLSKAQYLRLIDFIKTSLMMDENGFASKIETNATKGQTDAFYEATGRYSIFNTCNSWANRGLKVAGQKACLWTAFEKAIFLKHK